MPGYARNPDAIADDVLVFASAAVRSVSLPNPMPSQITYLEDTKLVQYWDGSTWRAVGGGATYSSSAPSTPQTGDVWIDSGGSTGTLNTNDFLLKNDATVLYQKNSDYTMFFFFGGL